MEQSTKDELLIYLDKYQKSKENDIQIIRDSFTTAQTNVFENEIINIEKKLVQANSESSFPEAIFYIILAVLAEEVIIAGVVSVFVASLIRVTNITRSLIKTGNSSILKNLKLNSIFIKADDFMAKSETYKLMTKATENIVKDGIKKLSSPDDLDADSFQFGKKSPLYGDTLMKFIFEQLAEFLQTQKRIVDSNVHYLKLRTIKDSKDQFLEEEAKSLINILKKESKFAFPANDNPGQLSAKDILTNYFEVILYLSHINLYNSVKLIDADTYEGYTQSSPLPPDVVSEIYKLYFEAKNPKTLIKNNLSDWEFLSQRAKIILGIEDNKGGTSNKAIIAPGSNYGKFDMQLPSFSKVAAQKILNFATEDEKQIYHFLNDIEVSLNNRSFNLVPN